MTTYEAVFVRQSTRVYRQEPLPAARLDAVRAMLEALDPLDAALPLAVHLVAEGAGMQRIISGIIGSYGKIRAPHYLVATADPSDASLTNVGYAVEDFVLRLTALDLGTCWIGGHVPASMGELVTVPAGQVPAVLVALGEVPPGASPHRAPGTAKRKAIDDLILAGTPDGRWRTVLEAVRLSPSAVNSQLWRFAFVPGAVHVYRAIPGNPVTRAILGRMPHIDLGIALRHMRVAMDHLGMVGRFEQQDVASYPGAAYVVSVVG